MSRGIIEQTNHTAYCEPCDWHGREYDNEEAAQQELEEHECRPPKK